MQPIPIDSGDFVEICKSKPRQLCVDKTAYDCCLISDSQVHCFFV